MRIGFDGSCLSNRRGFGRFSRLLLEATARKLAPSHRLVVVIDRPSYESVELPKNVEPLVVEVSQAPSAAASAQGRRRIGDMLAMARAVARARLDLIYFPATYTFFPVWNVKTLIVTLHDILPMAHPEQVFSSHQGRLAWKAKEHLAVRMADRIVTVSETSRRDIQRWFRLPADKLRVITEGPDPVFLVPREPAQSERVLSKYGLNSTSRYLIYVGGLSPHKNLPRLIRGFAKVADPSLSLMIVGDFKDVFLTQIPEIRRAIEQGGVERRVLLPGYVPDDDLAHLYQGALALAQPSLLEGFGLPPVEAMARGTPVVASRAGSLPEVVGDAGLFFDPTDETAIANAIERISMNASLRDDLAARAVVRASSYSWDRAADLLIDCFNEYAPDRRHLATPRYSGFRGRQRHHQTH